MSSINKTGVTNLFVIAQQLPYIEYTFCTTNRKFTPSFIEIEKPFVIDAYVRTQLQMIAPEN
jgi:hypothetical protein